MMKISVEELGSFLEQRTPRRIPSSIRKQALRQIGLAGVMFGLIFGSFGVPFVYIFFPWRIVDNIYLSTTTHATAQGKVLSKYETNMNENNSSVYKYGFSFVAEDGVEYRGICYKTSAGLNKGAGVEIEYFPNKPEVARIHGCRLSAFGWGGAFVLLFPLAGFGVAFFTLRARLRRVDMLRNGVFSSGLITSVDSTNVRVNNRRRYKVSVSFDDSRGIDRVSKYNAYGDEVSTAKRKCDNKEPVGLLYDINNPKRVFLVDSLI